MRGQVDGLCGDADNVRTNEYRRNQGCTMNTREEYVASYALFSKGCQGPALLHKQKSDMSLAVCKRHFLQRNIINDKEAGRKPQDQNRHHTILKAQNDQEERSRTTSNLKYRTRYFYEEEKDGTRLMCFSTMPVPECSFSRSRIQLSEEKEYDFFCTQDFDKAMEMKSIIDEEFPTDFSDQSVSRSQRLTVPLICSDPI